MIKKREPERIILLYIYKTLFNKDIRMTRVRVLLNPLEILICSLSSSIEKFCMYESEVRRRLLSLGDLLSFLISLFLYDML